MSMIEWVIIVLIMIIMIIIGVSVTATLLLRLRSTNAELNRLMEANKELRQLNENWRKEYDSVAALKETLRVLEGRILDVNNVLTTKQGELDNLVGIYTTQFKELESLMATHRRYQDMMLSSDHIIRDQNNAIEANKIALAQCSADLQFWLHQSMEARISLNETKENPGFEVLALDGREQRLKGLLDEVCGLYPELSVDLRSIEWKKLWLSRMQTLGRYVGNKGGIYRLIRSDGVCYVGQAVNFKERWYTHAKKLIGAQACGNEKLYAGGGQYTPADFRWEVICEIKDEDRGKMNEVERYWIEYYQAELNK